MLLLLQFTAGICRIILELKVPGSLCPLKAFFSPSSSCSSLTFPLRPYLCIYSIFLLITAALKLSYRRVADRPRDPAKWSEIADVVDALTIPVIANGDVFEYEDFGRIKTATGR